MRILRTPRGRPPISLRRVARFRCPTQIALADQNGDENPCQRDGDDCDDGTALMRASDPLLWRADGLPLAQRRCFRPSEGKVDKHLLRVLSPGPAGPLHRLFCVLAELLSFCHGALHLLNAPR